MKLVVLTAVISFKKEIQHMLKQAGIKTYSYRDVTGFKDLSEEALASNWFGSEMHENESIAFYVVVPKENMDQLMLLITAFNEQLETRSKVHLASLSIENYL
ncbi:hypothetical protein [Flavobacterium sp.]|jgi:hypothetical protein|uniref:hypothetical protein n=1 Tax=Flavobacterium sp. TaxID=239 RepID=UPI0037BED0FD